MSSQNGIVKQEQADKQSLMTMPGMNKNEANSHGHV